MISSGSQRWDRPASVESQLVGRAIKSSGMWHGPASGDLDGCRRRAPFLEAGDRAAQAGAGNHSTRPCPSSGDRSPEPVSPGPRGGWRQVCLRRLAESTPCRCMLERGLSSPAAMPGRGTAGPYGHPIFKVLRTLLTVSRVSVPPSHRRRLPSVHVWPVS